MYAFAACAAICVAAVMVLHLSITTTEFSRHNPYWNGTSAFFSRAEAAGAVEIRDLSMLESANGTRLLIIAPGENFTAADIGRYRSYIGRGNTIVLADDFGSGNQLLAGLGSSIRLLQDNLSSMDMEYSDPRTVIGYRAENASILNGVESIVLNRPAALQGGEILVETSVLSWIDANGNQRVDAGETLGRYGVLSHERIGSGDLYVLSDPSICTNGMMRLDRSRDNPRLIANLLQGDGGVMLDQANSRTACADGFAGPINAAKNTTLIKIALICVVLMPVGFAFKRKIL
ncbi:hypothetical protein ASZ90_008920 [hydrocarbon metagenome]|uniref:DUF4350 domain-containing protein n=1 Tax=hydrocarbon metagenome TaxID=938273 RepID=A0A0W8FK86_9ZZZZ